MGESGPGVNCSGTHPCRYVVLRWPSWLAATKRRKSTCDGFVTTATSSLRDNDECQVDLRLSWWSKWPLVVREKADKLDEILPPLSPSRYYRRHRESPI